ncbi:MAG: hypothetical protein J3K34DRAFT_440969 [Monoraphidium minutum]|nr:MAG: hypothetical protein J3K34DRAFT_440969 [Monoraphidium minutum]
MAHGRSQRQPVKKPCAPGPPRTRARASSCCCGGGGGAAALRWPGGPAFSRGRRRRASVLGGCSNAKRNLDGVKGEGQAVIKGQTHITKMNRCKRQSLVERSGGGGRRQGRRAASRAFGEFNPAASSGLGMPRARANVLKHAAACVRARQPCCATRVATDKDAD